jgi:hypothetical protein
MIRKNPVSSVFPAIGSDALQPYGTIAAASACNKDDRFAPLSSFYTLVPYLRVGPSTFSVKYGDARV